MPLSAETPAPVRTRVRIIQDRRETAATKSSLLKASPPRQMMLSRQTRTATLAPMSKSTTEISSGAVRDIEPELRELFTKIVERDPREAVKMLQPYPDEFVVKLLRFLHAAAAGSFQTDNARRRSYGANSPAREKNDYHLCVRDGRRGQTSWGSGHAR